MNQYKQFELFWLFLVLASCFESPNFAAGLLIGLFFFKAWIRVDQSLMYSLDLLEGEHGKEAKKYFEKKTNYTPMNKE